MSVKNVLYCSVKYCKNNSNNNKLYAFPLDKERSSIWVKFCESKKVEKCSNSTLHRYKKVCNVHFDNSSFIRVVSPHKDRLRNNAIPTLKGPRYIQDSSLAGKISLLQFK